MSKTIVGIDFGHGVIRAAEVTRAGKQRPVVRHYQEVEIPSDAVREGVVVDEEAVVSALRWLWKVGSFSTKRVVIGMGSQQVLIRELTLPAMPMKHLRETLPFRVQDLLPLPAEDAVLDFFPLEEVDDEDERQIRGLLVAATRESVLANIRALRKAGLQVVDVDLIPFAVSRLHLADDADGTRILVHVGAVSTSVIVVDRGLPQFVRLLPNGGADLTGAIAERLNMRVDRAEEIKRRVGLVPVPGDAASATMTTIGLDTARDTVQAIRATISFYEHVHTDSRVQSVVLSGGGAQLRGLAEHVETATGLPVATGQVASAFTMGPGLDEATLIAAGAGPTVALGLTLRSAA